MHVHFDDPLSVNLNVVSDAGGQVDLSGLIGMIGPFHEQEIPPAMNPAVSITDTQFFDFGPFSKVDKKGAVLGPATGVVPSTGDATLLAGDTSANAAETAAGLTLAPGALRFRSVVAAGAVLPATVQAVATDDAGKTGVVDVTITAGAEAGITGAVSAPAEQP